MKSTINELIASQMFQGKALSKFKMLMMVGSILFALAPALLYILIEYRKDLSQQSSTVKLIENAHLATLSSALWHLDKGQIELQLNGILQLSGVKRLELYEQIDNTPSKLVASAGIVLKDKKKSDSLTIIPLVFSTNGKNFDIGNLHVFTNTSEARNALLVRILTISIFVIALAFLFYLFQKRTFDALISKPLRALSSGLSEVAQKSMHLLSEAPETISSIPDVSLQPEAVSQSADEFNIIMKSFSKLTQSLSNVVVDLKLQVSQRQKLEKRERFLIELSQELPKHLDSYLGAVHFTKRCTVEFSSWCVVDLISEGGTFQRLAVSHQKPDFERILREKLPLAEENLLWFFPDSNLNHMKAETIVASSQEKNFTELFHFEKPCNLPETETLIITQLHTSKAVLGRAWFGFTTESKDTFEFESASRFFAEQLVAKLASSIEISRLYEKSLASNRAKENLLQMVSHELRTPLTAVLGWSSVLKEREIDPEVFHDAIERIEKNAETLLSVVNNLIDASDARSHQLQINATAINITPLIKNAIEKHVHKASKRQISFQSRFEIDSGPVLGDADRLAQVFSNVIENAVKFSFDKGVIEVVVSQFENFVEVTVSDKGTGMSTEFLSRIFDRFTQQETGLTRSFGGLGLGLSLSYDFIMLHGGTIHASSEGLGQGSNFCIRIPSLTTSLAPESINFAGSSP